tara:strand:+ start:435 stop:686 length:252 start_codon:yes stop_codon:yes gene_type:complete
MNSNIQNLINKIIYRSKYRGTKEMDIFVSSFVNSVIHDLTYEELKELDQIIDLSDEELIEIRNDNNSNRYKNTKLIKSFKDFK